MARGSARKWKTLGVRDHGRSCSVTAHSRLMILRPAERSSGSTSPHGSSGRGARRVSLTPRPSITSPVSASVVIVIPRAPRSRSEPGWSGPLPDPPAVGRHPQRYGVGPREALEIEADAGDALPILVHVLADLVCRREVL